MHPHKQASLPTTSLLYGGGDDAHSMLSGERRSGTEEAEVLTLDNGTVLSSNQSSGSERLRAIPAQHSKNCRQFDFVFRPQRLHANILHANDGGGDANDEREGRRRRSDVPFQRWVYFLPSNIQNIALIVIWVL